MKALIDADVLIYHACNAVQEVIDWGDDCWSVHADVRRAVSRFEDSVQDILDATHATSYVLAVSDFENFRMEVCDTYKANRANKPKPVAYKPLKNWVLCQPETCVLKGVEADDVLGILQTSDNSGTVLCTIDKDLLQIPGKHINISKLEEGIFEVTEEDGDKQHWIQMLAGDAVDGFSGVPGLGMIKAKALLEKYGYEWPVVVGAYAKKGLSEYYALAMARLARILRAGEYDYFTRSPILWTP